ncbi:membrane protein insertase YidC [Rheinheimera baltica]|uniref:Membrane protein insertase YidC n=1 Tax=Rheinheimera baltica TaxID=67576 RepID=A0ABT9HXJ0_9GAMM|nr:membrane protein insertase YidC [Rheinheimera baltica]MDP5135845.1 membrane protein insertase YidC [Rheinheimera baltica]MDP5143755.1 membrane protein insertase YidC [Rheinheimera baltica]MDP5151864.1 membrane protein insertase YidC [Rheinheimera baltica]
MESQRSLLVIGLALVSFLLWQQWNIDTAPKPVTPVTQNSDSTGSSSADLQLTTADAEQSVATVAAAARTITVSTDVFNLRIDSRGGDIVGLELPAFELNKGEGDAYPLMRKLNGFEYVAQSGLIGRDGPDDSRNPRPVYTAEKSSYALSSGATELVVPLLFNHNGLQIEKRFTFVAGQYDVRVEYFIKNQSTEVKTVQPYQHMVQTIDNGEGSSMMMPIYRGAAFGTSSERYNKYAFDDMQEKNLLEATTGGWVAMLEHYFVSAWVPDAQTDNQLYSLVRNGQGVIGAKGPAVNIEPGAEITLTSTFYAGPKDQDSLAKIANGLDLTVDYGFLWFISQPLFWLLTTIQGFVVNWGVAIICITLIVKGAMYPLTKVQYESMAKMRNLKPKIDELQARYKEDRQKMGPAMMELYRKEKVNPMGGCLPMIIQMPIFLALYWVFVESVELRHAPFMLWINDLSAQDPYYVLPVLFGLSMFLMQKLTPMQVTDPMQQKIMMWMPVAFSVFFLWFPSGLVLYWFVSNLISLAQMLYIYKGMEKKGLHTKKA